MLCSAVLCFAFTCCDALCCVSGSLAVFLSKYIALSTSSVTALLMLCCAVLRCAVILLCCAVLLLMLLLCCCSAVLRCDVLLLSWEAPARIYNDTNFEKLHIQMILRTLRTLLFFVLHTVEAVLLCSTYFVVVIERLFGIYTFTCRRACLSIADFIKTKRRSAQAAVFILAAVFLHDLAYVERRVFQRQLKPFCHLYRIPS